MPGRLPPNEIDDSDWSDDAIMRRKAWALASLVVAVPVFGAGLVVVACLELWRKIRGRD